MKIAAALTMLAVLWLVTMPRPAATGERTRTMSRASLDSIELEYEVRGTGEPVVLVHAGVLRPLVPASPRRTRPRRPISRADLSSNRLCGQQPAVGTGQHQPSSAWLTFLETPRTPQQPRPPGDDGTLFGRHGLPTIGGPGVGVQFGAEQDDVFPGCAAIASRVAAGTSRPAGVFVKAASMRARLAARL
jgi:hypothetical protein